VEHGGGLRAAACTQRAQPKHVPWIVAKEVDAEVRAVIGPGNLQGGNNKKHGVRLGEEFCSGAYSRLRYRTRTAATYNSLEAPAVHLSQEARVLGVLEEQRDDGPLELVRLDDPPRPAVAVPADAVPELRARQDLVPVGALRNMDAKKENSTVS
jgi:hypothetical protein